MSDAQRVTPSGVTRIEVQKKVLCDECGEELIYAWMHSGRASFHVGRCMRCNPEPPILIRE